MSTAMALDTQTAHNFTFLSTDTDEAGKGGEIVLADYAGKTVLIVNTASFCGFTKQYAALQTLWQKYRDSGLIILAIPSNDFGAQEPGSKAEIIEFCETTFGIDFPIADKEHVKGPGAHPFYVWARQELGMIAAPKWNFHKYLIGPDGKLEDWFSTITKPSSPRITKAIEKLLAKAP